MDATQIILIALEAGRRSDDPDVTAAFGELTTLLRSALAADARATRALEDFLDDPETYERPLVKALAATQAHQAPAIQDIAERLLQADPAQPTDILRQIADRERLRTGDRFTHRAQSMSGIKAQEEEAARRRTEQYWEAEYRRREEVATRQAQHQHQQRRMLIGVLTIAAIIVIVFMIILVVTARG
jgi:hypothetical protein